MPSRTPNASFPSVGGSSLRLLAVLAGAIICLSACRGDPVPIGISPAAKTSRVDEGIASEIAQSRQLCVLHGDANCKEVMDDDAARNDPDYSSWWDPIWTGGFKEVPESQGSQRH